ncbi:hypothetical protein BB560_004600 [Smittium megazygosporum]|uniref:Bacterial surface antigen (D15) domain-containing protein n=1 Tax=Smittium megazygosporum TaxID=133381 RepID=A0A2T9Z8S1_9FUNG|nr:hypothetical protein BB560_004600 [Smittium megazygosporum]
MSPRVFLKSFTNSLIRINKSKNNENSNMSRHQNEVKETQVKIQSLEVTGLKNTRKGVLNKIVQPVIGATTLTEAFIKTQQAVNILKQLDLVKDVEVEIGKSDISIADSSDKVPISVKFTCEESRRALVRTGAEVSSGDFNCNVSGKLKNVFGGGEYFEIENIAYKENGNSVQTNFSTPIGINPRFRFTLSGVQNWSNNRIYSGYKEILRDFSANISKSEFFHKNTFAYNLSWRNICDLSENASPSIRNEAGHSLKSSISYIYERDTWNAMDPKKSYYKLRLFSEFAGLGGDASYIKNQVDLKSELNIYKQWSLMGVLRIGTLFPLNNSTIHISDRFFLGGPASIRGVQFRGMGPFDRKDSLGGDFYGLASLSLLTPLPFIKTDKINGQIWLNAGNLKMWEKMDIFKPSLSIFDKPTAISGFGITYMISNFKVELNYCLPISARTSDKLRKGFQIGVGIVF